MIKKKKFQGSQKLLIKKARAWRESILQKLIKKIQTCNQVNQRVVFQVDTELSWSRDCSRCRVSETDLKWTTP